MRYRPASIVPDENSAPSPLGSEEIDDTEENVRERGGAERGACDIAAVAPTSSVARGAAAVESSASGRPQERQNRAPEGAGAPQDVQKLMAPSGGGR